MSGVPGSGGGCRRESLLYLQDKASVCEGAFLQKMWETTSSGRERILLGLQSEEALLPEGKSSFFI